MIDQIAAELNATSAQVALAWLLSRGDDIAMIPGTRREDRLTGNWEAQRLSVLPIHLERIAALAARGVAGSRY